MQPACERQLLHASAAVINGLQHFDAHLGMAVAHEDAQQALSQDLTAVVADAVAAMARRATTKADLILICVRGGKLRKATPQPAAAKKLLTPRRTS